MKLYDEQGTLQHVDSSSDVLQHYGKKGMKWGVRKTAEYARAYGRLMLNRAAHPVLEGKAGLKALAKGKLLPTKRNLDYRNRYVKDRLDAKKQYKKDKKELDKKYSEKEDRIGNSKGDNATIAKRENRNAAEHLAARKRLKDNYKRSKKSAGGSY